MRFVMALCGVLLLSGCPTVSTMGLARTMPKGTLQGHVALEALGLVVNTGAGTSTPSNYNVVVPQLEGGVRYSVSDNLEIGGRLWLAGIALDTKIGLLRSPNERSGFNLSLDPAVGFFGFTGATSASGGSAGLVALQFYLPVMIGIDFGGHELVIAPKLIDELFVVGGGGVNGGLNVLYVGGSLGIALRLSDKFRLMPEVSIAYPVWASAATGGASGSTSAIAGQGFQFQAGVGAIIGGPDKRSPRETETPHRSLPPPGYAPPPTYAPPPSEPPPSEPPAPSPSLPPIDD